MSLCEFKELDIEKNGFEVFFHAFLWLSILLLSYFKFTQIIGNDNDNGKALQVPGEFQTDGKKRPFTIDSHLHHARFVLKKNSEETKKHAEHIQL